MAAPPAPGAEQVHTFKAQGAAVDLWKARANEVLMSGPAGTGKSRACLEKLHALMLKYPGARGLMVRKTRESLTSTGLVTFREKVANEAIDTGLVEWYGGSHEEPPQYRYGNSSKIMVGGMDKPTKIMSSEYDVIFVQEAIELTVTDWENLTTRLRNGVVRTMQLIADTNPDRPQHWLKQRADTGATSLIECRHEDNPMLYDAAARDWTDAGRVYMARLGALTGVRKERLLRGRWVTAEGLVYENWDPSVHLLPAMRRPPKSWPVFWSIDFGYTNPFVCQWWAQDPDGRLHLYRELYRTKRLVEDHAKDIMRQVATCKRQCDRTDRDHFPLTCERCQVVWMEARPTAIICDHDAEDRATLTKHLRLQTVPAKKTKTRGIQCVESRLKVQPDGHPRLYIHRDALTERDELLEEAKLPLCTEQEIGGYVWPPEAVAGTAPKEEPVKRDDHGMDGMRYIVAHHDLKGRYDIKWL